MVHKLHNSKILPFDQKNIGYLVGWNNTTSQEGEGYTLVKNIADLTKGQEGIIWRLPDNSHSWLEMSHPGIYQFSGLEAYLNGNKQKWVKWTDELPKNRELTQEETMVLYGSLKKEIMKYHPQTLAEILLPMFYK